MEIDRELLEKNLGWVNANAHKLPQQKVTASVAGVSEGEISKHMTSKLRVAIIILTMMGADLNSKQYVRSIESALKEKL